MTSSLGMGRPSYALSAVDRGNTKRATRVQGQVTETETAQNQMVAQANRGQRAC